MIAERLEEARKRAPALAGGLVGLVVDNPAQFAVVVSGSYVITRMMVRAVRPYGPAGVFMTAAASYAVCLWLMSEGRRRGILEFRVRGPHGELVTLAELAELAAECGCVESPPPG